MELIEDVRQATGTFPHVVLTIGSFDGVHRGHQAIVQQVLRAARVAVGTAAVMTLDPHPRQYFAPENAPNILTPLTQKQAIMESLGIDVFYVLPFNQDIAGMDRQAFLEEIVLGRCHARELIVGHDFAFGKGAKGNYEWLEAVAPGYGLKLQQVQPLILQGERVSSTLIRERILQGDMDEAELFLGRKYAIPGKVIRGRGIGGSKLGYPTANIKPHNNAVPAHGVYIAEARLEGRSYASAVNIGIAPTIRHEDVMIEAFILDFDADIVDQDIEIVFHRRMRPEKKFDTYEELIRAIDDDVSEVRRYFDRQAGQ
jgi:riboflavin kinase/FMN adenylyltransferase